MVKFGTSGMRGLVTELTDKVCYLYTIAFLRHLSQEKLISKGMAVALAGDMRPSTDKILKAVVAAIKDSGLEVDYCGKVPTPTISLYGFVRNLPNIMVTGSHIPHDRNGIKFNLPHGEVLKNNEKAITEIYSKLSEEEDLDALFYEDSLKKPYDMPPINRKAHEEYVERYLQFFEANNLLKGKTIVAYQHSAVGRDTLVEILEKLGAKVIPVERSDEFIPIDTESIQEEILEKARLWAKEHACDAIVSTDGDSDRPALFDENGNFIRGDILGIICSDFLKADSVSATASCNTALEKCGIFKKINRTKIGSPYVIEAMMIDHEAGMRSVSYEANGGFLTAGDIEMDGRPLRALPTRDAVLPIIAAISSAIKKGLSLSGLVDSYPKRYIWTETIKEFPTEISQEIINRIIKAKDRAEKVAEELFDLPSTVEKIDYIDGVRKFMANDEIVHMRPSGNAPEFRIYIETKNLDRSKELAKLILKKVDSLRRQI